MVFVSPSCENITPEEEEILEELEEGKMVRVEEIVQLPHQLRVRALGTSSGLDYLAESGDGKALGDEGG